MSTPDMKSLNWPRIHTGESLTESDFARIYPEEPQPRSRIADAIFAFVLGILGGVGLVHLLVRFA